jgi:acetyl esterase/lipase
MTAPDRRSFMAAAAASIATPVGLGAKECPTSAALCGYTLAPEASLTQITNELKSAFDWLDATAGEHGAHHCHRLVRRRTSDLVHS